MAPSAVREALRERVARVGRRQRVQQPLLAAQSRPDRQKEHYSQHRQAGHGILKYLVRPERAMSAFIGVFACRPCRRKSATCTTRNATSPWQHAGVKRRESCERVVPIFLRRPLLKFAIAAPRRARYQPDSWPRSSPNSLFDPRAATTRSTTGRARSSLAPAPARS